MVVKWKYHNKVEFHFNGAWNDATLVYKGVEFNEHIVLDTMWERFNEDCEEFNIEPTNENFDQYMINKVYEIEELLELTVTTNLENRIALTLDKGCPCNCENDCYFVTVHETENMDDDGLDTFMIHGDEYEDDNSGKNVYKEAYKRAKGGN